MTKPCGHPAKHRLAVAAIFKGENFYLQEWLEYHLCVGVDHFYLYDNDGGEQARQILKPYEDQGIVTRHDWVHLDGGKMDGPTPFRQRNKNHAAHGHSAKMYRNEFDWIAKIDLDEFLVPLEGDDLPTLLDRYDRKKVKGLRVPRYNFGDCGHRDRPENLVIEAYTKREATWSDHKDVANGKFLSSNEWTNSAHRWGHKWYKPGRMICEEEITEVRINHYYTKSLEEHLQRQNTSRGRPQSIEGFFEKNEGRNDVDDDALARFGDRVREGINRR
jgi:hypothetical protein